MQISQEHFSSRASGLPENFSVFAAYQLSGTLKPRFHMRFLSRQLDAIFVALKATSSFKHARNPCDIAATSRTENRTWFTRGLELTSNLSYLNKKLSPLFFACKLFYQTFHSSRGREVACRFLLFKDSLSPCLVASSQAILLSPVEGHYQMKG